MTAGQEEVVYDWRVVVVRGSLYTELIPTTVTELGIGMTSWTRQAGDVDMTTIAEGDVLAWNDTTGKLEPAVRVSVSGTPTTGHLAEFTDADTVEDAGLAVSDLALAELPFQTYSSSGSIGVSPPHIILCSAAISLGLPPASGSSGKPFYIRNTSSGSVTITRNGSDTIDGATSVVLANQYESVVLVSDGTSLWHRLTEDREDAKWLAIPASATTDKLATFTSGKQVQDGGKKLSDLLQLAAGGTVSGDTDFTGLLTPLVVRGGGSKTGISDNTITSLWRETLSGLQNDGGMYLVWVSINGSDGTQSY